MLVLTIITWVFSGLIALAFAMAGTMKLIAPHNESRPMPTLLDYSPGQVRVIGALELLGAIAVVVAPLLPAPYAVLAPIAAFALALIQFLAVFAHRKHNEPFVVNIVLMLVAAVVGVLRLVGA